MSYTIVLALTALSLKYVCHMTCSIGIMEEYVIKHSELGHFQYFQDRKSIWGGGGSHDHISDIRPPKSHISDIGPPKNMQFVVDP